MRLRRRALTRLPFCVLWVLLVAPDSPLRGDAIVTVADSSTPLPEGGGNFTSFAGELGNETQLPPVIDGGNVLFAGHGADDQHGLYLWHAGSIRIVADTGTPVPDGTGTFDGYRSATLSGDNVAFQAFSSGNRVEGIYLASGGAVTRVADDSVAPPGGTAKFRGFAIDPPVSGADVFFAAGVGATAGGMYRFHNGSLFVLADMSTPTPGATGTFTSLNSQVVGKNGSVIFTGITNGTRGVYGYVGGSLVRIADTTTPLPGGGGTFGNFDNGVLGYDGTTAVFLSGGFLPGGGLYAASGGVIRRIALNSDPLPDGGTFSFNNLSTVAVDGDIIAFIGQSGSLYADVGDDIRRVIGAGDVLSGKTIEDIHINPDGLSGDQLAFVARFTDRSSGIYIATVPEPAALAPLLSLLLLLRKRRPFSLSASQQ